MSFLLSNPLSPQQRVATPPIVAQTPPPTSGPQALQFDLGSIWVDSSANIVYVLTSISGGILTWVNTIPAAGGVFTDITVSPGPSSFTGEFRVLGNVNEANVIQLQENAGASGTIGIISAQGTSASSIYLHSLAGGINEVTDVGNIALTASAGTVTVAGNAGTANDIVLNATTAGGGVTINSDVGGVNIVTSGAFDITATGGLDLDITGALSFDATLASNFTVTGALQDLTLSSSGGSVNVSASEAAVDAIKLNASAGGIQLASVSDTAITSSTGDIDLTSTAGDITLNASTFIALTPMGVSSSVSIASNTNTSTIGIGNVSPAASRTTTISGGAVPIAATDTLNLATGGTNTDPAAVKIVNIASDATGTGSQTVNILSGTNAVGSVSNVNISTGTGGGTKLVDIGNNDNKTTMSFVGPFNLNNQSTATGAIAIGNSTAGGVVAINSIAASNFTVTGAAADLTLSSSGGSVVVTASEAVTDAIVITATGAGGGIKIGDTASLVLLDLGNITPTVNRVTTINGGVVNAANTDTLNLGTGGVSTNAGAHKIVNIASDTTLVGTQAVNVGNADGITAITARGVVNVNDSGPGATTIGNAAAGGAIALTTNTSVGIDSKTASHMTVTGAADLTLSSTAGAVIVSSAKAGASAIQLNCSDVAASIVATMNSGNVAISNTGELTVTGDNIALGTAAKGIVFQAGPTIVAGAGSPNTAVTATKGSLYLRTDGSGVNDRMFVNTDGATAWTAVVTVA